MGILDGSVRLAILARFPTVTRKTLEIDMESTEGYLPGLSSLLWNSPDLEHLTINLMPPDSDEFEPMDYFSVDRDPYLELLIIEPSPIQHLKSVKITGFAAGSCLSSHKVLVEMVQYLLANAKVLQKLIIYAEADSKISAKFEIAQKLLSYPRASPDAVVLFESHLW